MTAVVDAHHHLWNFNEEEFGWMTPEMERIRRDFTEDDFKKQIRGVPISGSVVVQARQTLAETDWLLSVAAESAVVAGVIGWFPLSDSDVQRELETRLASPQSRKTLIGVRHVVQDEPDPNFLFEEAFNTGVSLLEKYNLAYDILIREYQLPQAIDFVDRHPNQVFVLDHIAKPRIAENVFEPWASRLTDLARRENVFCKVSGVITEAEWGSWYLDSIRKYLDHAFEAFKPRRIMFGSDWPVCLLAGSYQGWLSTFRDYTGELSKDEVLRVFSGTATEAYGLEVQ
jgi:L-fuconolactonase